MKNLKDRTVAILTETGFEEIELTNPKKRLEEEGATVHILSPAKENVISWNNGNWNLKLGVDRHVSEVNVDEYDALVLPGGVINPDRLRRSKEAINLVKDFFEQGKPIAAICHGPQILIETGALKGRFLTSFSSIRTDLENCGAHWRDEEVVVDQGLVTSRTPKDLEAFNNKMIEEFKKGKHAGQMTV